MRAGHFPMSAAQVSTLNAFLKQKGACLKEEWIRAALTHQQNRTDQEQVYQQFLCSDMRQSALPTLPSDAGSYHKRSLPGPLILQVNEIFNAGDSLEHRSEESSSRMLKLALTDGHTCLYGFEYRRLPTSIHIHSKPGLKIKVTNVMIRRGLLMLQAQNCEILGGSVASLCDQQAKKEKEKKSKRDAPQMWDAMAQEMPAMKKQAYPSMTGIQPRAIPSPDPPLSPPRNIPGSTVSSYFHKKPTPAPTSTPSPSLPSLSSRPPLSSVKREAPSVLSTTGASTNNSSEVVDLVDESTEGMAEEDLYFSDEFMDDEMFNEISRYDEAPKHEPSSPLSRAPSTSVSSHTSSDGGSSSSRQAPPRKWLVDCSSEQRTNQSVRIKV